MKKALLLAGLSMAGLAACGAADVQDFQKEAQKFISNDKKVQECVGADVSSTTCEKPAKVEKGQTFDCTATLADGKTVVLTATITGDKNFVVGAQGQSPVDTTDSTDAPTTTG